MSDGTPAGRSSVASSADAGGRTLVVTCGNRQRGDDGFGPAVAELLGGDPGIRVIDLGLRPAGLLDHLTRVPDGGDGSPEPDVLVVVDAVRVDGAEPGRLIVVDWNDPARPPLAHDDPLSTHGLCIDRQLELARALGWLPARTVLVGVTIGATDHGAEISERVRAQVRPAVRRVYRELQRRPPRPAAG